MQGMCVRGEAVVEISRETKQQERNKSHHLFSVLLRILLPLLWHSTIALFSEKGKAARLTFICWIHNSLTIPKWQGRESFLFLNLIFHSHRVTGVAGYHSVLNDYLNTFRMPGKWKQRRVHACFFYLLYPLLIQGHGHHTQKTLNRWGTDSLGSTVLRQDMVMWTKWVSYAWWVALKTDPFLWKGCWNIR